MKNPRSPPQQQQQQEEQKSGVAHWALVKANNIFSRNGLFLRKHLNNSKKKHFEQLKDFF